MYCHSARSLLPSIAPLSLLVHILPSQMAAMADQEALIRSAYQASAATWPFTAMSTSLFGMRLFSSMRLQKDAIDWGDLVISVSWVRFPL